MQDSYIPINCIEDLAQLNMPARLNPFSINSFFLKKRNCKYQSSSEKGLTFLQWIQSI